MPAILGMSVPAFLAQTLGSGAMMGIGYTSGDYAGYGGWNTADPYGIHSKGKSNKGQQIKLSGMAYGMYGYGRYRRRYSRFRRRRYYRRYSRFRRYRGYY